MSVLLSQVWGAKYTGMWLEVGICAFGRAADFATTWVGISAHRAEEAKAGAAQLFTVLGPHRGLIAYEALITTPAIFLGCHLLRRSRVRRSNNGSADQAPGRAERMFFFSLGVVSFIAASHNASFLF